MDRSAVRKVLNICIAAVVIVAWVVMFAFGTATFGHSGFGSLKYFTVLSNLFEAAASIAWLLAGRGGGKPGHSVERLKYIAAAAVGLTFVVVIVLFGPQYGLASMYTGPNLWFHLLVPLAAMAEMLFLSEEEFSVKDNNAVVIAPFTYGVVYLVNILINGIGEWPNTNDWYGFLRWGYPAGAGIFAAACTATWLIGFVLRKL